MTTWWSNNLLASRPIERAMRQFARHFSSTDHVLDIGCGHKPYAQFFSCRYTGTDHTAGPNVDIVAPAWDVPLPDSSCDGIVMNQSLEHIADTSATITEVRRLLKPGGHLIVTVPQTMKNHSAALPADEAPLDTLDSREPYWRVDYWRFTKFGLFLLFRDFKHVQVRPTTGYGGSLFQLLIYFIAASGYNRLAAPLYLLLNVMGAFADGVGREIGVLVPRFRHFMYDTLTINYILTAQLPHEDHS